MPLGVGSPDHPVRACRGTGRKGLDVIRPVLLVERRGDISWCYAVSEVGFCEYGVASEPIERNLVATDFVVLPLVEHIHAVVENPDVPVVRHGDDVVLLPVGRELLVEAAGGNLLEHAAVLGFP